MPPLGSPLAVLSRAPAWLLAPGCAPAAGQMSLPGHGAVVLVGENVLACGEVPERGGALREQRPSRSLEVTEAVARVWPIHEVPDGSRRQLALSGWTRWPGRSC